MRITSGDELKQQNGWAALLIFPFYEHPAPTAILVRQHRIFDPWDRMSG